MKYRIFPPLGIARVGDSDDFFVGPEWSGGLGTEIRADGSERDLQQLKDGSFRVKRQAARFRIFEFADDSSIGRPLTLPMGASIRWQVHLVNKKAAINRPPAPPNPAILTFPIAAPQTGKILDGGRREISGTMAAPVPFPVALHPLENRPDYLGELRTDANQNVIVLGGRGKSVGDEQKLTHYYRNDTWYDDVSDGPVTAEIVFGDGSPSVAAEPAWVIVSPPDFAPTLEGIVTLYDLLYQVGYEHFGLTLPANPSFTEHVYPILKRAIRLQWVHEHSIWSELSTDFAALSDSSCQSPAPSLRTATLEKLQELQNNTEILDRFSLLPFQKDLLQSWDGGDVQCDWQGVPAVDRTVTPEGLTRAALEGSVGARLHPGIEAGGLLTRKEVYVTPFAFRLLHDVLQPGDVTAYMALPWQADFWECRDHWWPSQRPDIIRLSRAPNDFVRWADGVSSHNDMVSLGTKLGMLRARIDPQGETIGMNEEGRDVTLPPRQI